MKSRKFRITNLNNYTGYIGTIPVKHSIATVTEDHQLRVIDRQKILGSYNFEEIIEEPEPEKETINITEHDVVQRSRDVRENDPVIAPIEKAGRTGTGNRRRSKKQR